MDRKIKQWCPYSLWLSVAWIGWIVALVAYLMDKMLLCAVASCSALSLLGLYFVKTRIENQTMFGKKISAEAMLPPEHVPTSTGTSSRQEKQFATLIAKSAVFIGDMDIEGDIHIWGKITGNIRVKEGAIHVMNAGQVEGELLAPKIIIDGKVAGTCCATTLDILENGELYGISRCAGMTIQRGGQFIGQSESSEPLFLQNGSQDVLVCCETTNHVSKSENYDSSSDHHACSTDDECSGNTYAGSGGVKQKCKI